MVKYCGSNKMDKSCNQIYTEKDKHEGIFLELPLDIIYTLAAIYCGNLCYIKIFESPTASSMAPGSTITPFPKLEK